MTQLALDDAEFIPPCTEICFFLPKQCLNLALPPVPSDMYIIFYFLHLAGNLVAQLSQALNMVQEVLSSSLRCYRIFQT